MRWIENGAPASGLRRFEQYLTYKDSGIAWLGRIPSHWEVKPLKHLTEFSTGWTPPTGREDLYGGEHLWANISDLGPRILSSTEKTISDAAIRVARLRIVSEGSLLFSFKLSVGTVSIAGANMYTNEAIAAFAPSSRVDTKYLYWAAPVIVPRNAQENIYGAPLLSRERIANAALVAPPIAEQRAIAAFLDRETARIDALVKKKEQLIELLQEKRTALITRAVTKGLDPSAPMKDSGIEWLGEIPAHWEVKRLRHVGDAIIGLTYEPDDVVGPDEGVLLLRASNVKDGRIILEDKVFVRTVIPEHLSTRLTDILICARSGSRDLIGKSAKIEADAVNLTFGTFMMVYRSSCNSFLFYVFNSALFEYQSASFLTSTINQLTVGNLKDMTVPVPTSREQTAIVAFLDRETARIDTLVTRVRQAIEHLKELRSAVISAAVTGKIDVREAVA